MTKQIITKEEVQKVAKLGRLNLSDQEKDKYTKDIEGILEYVQVLGDLSVDDAEKVDHLKASQNQVRVDDVVDFEEDGKELIRKNFPERKDNLLKVKAVL